MADELNEVRKKNGKVEPYDILRAYGNATMYKRRLKPGEEKKIRKEAVKKLADLKVEFKEWNAAHNWFYYDSEGSEFKKLIAKKMAETAKTFDDWHNIYSKHVFCAEYIWEAVQKMKELAIDERELKIMLRATQYDPGVQNFNKLIIDKKPATFGEWLKMYRSSVYCPAHRKDIAELIFEIDAGFDELYLTYKRSRKSNIICRYLTMKIKMVEAKLEDWCRVYIEIPESEELRFVALGKIKERVM